MPHILVEDMYGVGFHRILMDKLIGAGHISCGEDKPRHRPSIHPLPAKKCNPAIAKKIIGHLFAAEKLLIVIDSEGLHGAAYVSVERHLEHHFSRHRGGAGLSSRVRVVVVEPRHEAWLCIGLGGKPGVCRSRPEDYLARLYGRKYLENPKSFLATHARYMEVGNLLSLRDFAHYLEGLRWLLCQRGAGKR